MDGKADDICIVKVIKIFFIHNFIIFKFLFCEWFVAFSSLICICKMLIDGVVIHLYWNNGLPLEYGCRENMAFEFNFTPKLLAAA